MGCDIHVFLEKKNKETNKWEQVKVWVKRNYFYSDEEEDSPKAVNENGEELYVPYPYNGRNYQLFSLLAGVRGWEDPLVDPRGLPKDCSEEVRTEYDKYGEYAYHTPTWYDMRELELLISNYDTSVKNADFFSPEELADLKGEKEGNKENLKNFFRHLCFYLELAEVCFWDLVPGEYRVILFFDN